MIWLSFLFVVVFLFFCFFVFKKVEPILRLELKQEKQKDIKIM